jgi:hypothetical protein
MKPNQHICSGMIRILPVVMLLACLSFLVSVRAGQPVNSTASASAAMKSPVKYLDLPIWQLKALGITCNSNGVFYKNQNPDWKKEKNKYQVLCILLADDNYCSNYNYMEGEGIRAKTKAEKLLQDLPETSNSFNPVMVTDLNGHRTWDAFEVLGDPSMKLLPVRINLEDLQMQKRKDFIVFWFKPTESLKNALAGFVNIDPFLAVP